MERPRRRWSAKRLARLQLVGLTSKRDDFARNLSRGMSQRLGVATLLVRNSEILLLDEPASGLDPKARIALRKILKKLATDGKTIIISSHILTEMEDFCTHIALMGNGKIKLHDDIASIRRRMRARAIVSLKVLDKADAVPKVVEGIDDMEIATRDGNAFTIEMDEDPGAVAELNKALVTAGIGVVELIEEKSGLEDIFMDISSEFDNS